MAWDQDHVHFKCGDYEATVRFFVENFGAKEESRVDSRGMAIVTLRIGESLYKFSPKMAGEVVDSITEPPHYGVYHVGFKTDDLEAEVVKMKARGVKFTQDLVQVNPQLRAAFIEGPDGISVELLQRGG
jgi:catechol 2,3-dioxygenase-like lactoylglutathione lyase family enzyme